MRLLLYMGHCCSRCDCPSRPLQPLRPLQIRPARLDCAPANPVMACLDPSRPSLRSRSGLTCPGCTPAAAYEGLRARERSPPLPVRPRFRLHPPPHPQPRGHAKSARIRGSTRRLRAAPEPCMRVRRPNQGGLEMRLALTLSGRWIKPARPNPGLCTARWRSTCSSSAPLEALCCLSSAGVMPVAAPRLARLARPPLKRPTTSCNHDGLPGSPAQRLVHDSLSSAA